MLSLATSKRVLLAIGLAGLLGGLSTTSASAGFHFGGGHFGGFHMAAPRISMPRISAPRIHAPRLGGGFRQRQFGGLVRPLGGHAAGLRHGARFQHEPRIKVGHLRPGCRHGRCFGPAVRVVTSAPAYVTPVVPVYQAPLPPVRPAYTAPVSPAPVAVAAPVAPTKVCTAGGTFLTIGFQPTASVADVAAFLKEYDIAVADGPNADGAFRVRLSAETLPLDKFGPMIESMKTKQIVASIAG